MTEKIHVTACGTIHYWVSHESERADISLIFLPGLTADHRLFDKQVEYFEGKVPVLVWDAPGHAASWPFELTFSLADKATWLKEILEAENLSHPVLVGQSMGAYVAQAFAEQYPGQMKGFISIDSAPLQRSYVTAAEIWLLKRMEPVYRHYPWKSLLKSGTRGVATSHYGRQLMYEMMMVYDGDQARYARLSGHGFRMLAEAMEADLPYAISCPALLICGSRDQAGSTRRYNRAWHRKTGIPLEWIRGAGHNSNTDNPLAVNELIDTFIRNLSEQTPDAVW